MQSEILNFLERVMVNLLGSVQLTNYGKQLFKEL
jgi:hypothetical protein